MYYKQFKNKSCFGIEVLYYKFWKNFQFKKVKINKNVTHYLIKLGFFGIYLLKIKKNEQQNISRRSNQSQRNSKLQ
jgi:hypothetical protein